MENILIIANKSVFPYLDGGSFAMNNLATTLSKNYIIDIIAISKSGFGRSKPTISNPHPRINQIKFDVEMKFNLISLIKSILFRQSYQINRFYRNDIRKYIQYKIDQKKYKLIIFESLFSMIYKEKLKIDTSTDIFLRTHNIEHKIWLDLANNSKNSLNKIIYLFLSLQIKRIEKKYSHIAKYILTISKNDTQYFKKHYPTKTHYIPVTFNTKDNKSKKIKNSIFHLGAMDWKPNIEGVSWFISNVYPLLIDDNIKCFFAGKNMPNNLLKRSDKNLYIEGLVINSKQYIENKNILIVPLFSGSGIRIKILESMSIGTPVISTTKGAQGIPYTNGENIIIANTPQEFRDSIYQLVTNQNLAFKIGNNGKMLIKSKFSNTFVLNKLNEILK